MRKSLESLHICTHHVEVNKKLVHLANDFHERSQQNVKQNVST
jgi:hypothetical protein